MQALRIVVMGVSGCGKSSLGAEVAGQLGLPLVEGDDFHAPESVAKMSSGVPLTDADRMGWLATLGREMAAHREGAVLTCSALKREYRERLRAAVPELRFVFLKLSPAEAEHRVASRADDHMFPASLVANQFATLESPEHEAGVLTVDAKAPKETLSAQVRSWLASPDFPSPETH